jgi:hypothetical protein
LKKAFTNAELKAAYEKLSNNISEDSVGEMIWSCIFNDFVNYSGSMYKEKFILILRRTFTAAEFKMVNETLFRSFSEILSESNSDNTSNNPPKKIFNFFKKFFLSQTFKK